MSDCMCKGTARAARAGRGSSSSRTGLVFLPGFPHLGSPSSDVTSSSWPSQSCSPELDLETHAPSPCFPVDPFAPLALVGHGQTSRILPVLPSSATGHDLTSFLRSRSPPSLLCDCSNTVRIDSIESTSQRPFLLHTEAVLCTPCPPMLPILPSPS